MAAHVKKRKEKLTAVFFSVFETIHRYRRKDKSFSNKLSSKTKKVKNDYDSSQNMPFLQR